MYGLQLLRGRCSKAEHIQTGIPPPKKNTFIIYILLLLFIKIKNNNNNWLYIIILSHTNGRGTDKKHDILYNYIYAYR